MKFFSNEAKDTEEPEYGRERHGDVVTSDPVAVPQQRAGSPWSDAPGSPESTTDAPADTSPADTSTADAEVGSPDDELAEQERRDGTDEEPAGRRDETGTVTTYGPDGTVTDHPAETDGHIHADEPDGHMHADSEPRSDVDIPLDDEARSDLDRNDLDRSDVDRRDETDGRDLDAGDPEASRRDETDSHDLDGADSHDLDGAGDLDETGRHAEAGRRDETDFDGRADEARTEDAIKDEGTFDSPAAVEPATGAALDEQSSAFAAADDTAKDRAEAEAEADETIEQERADERKAELDGQPVAIAPEPVPVAAAATPGSVPAPALDRLFGDSDTFAERFRDIQLRFVDSPKEATADAAILVGEAVDKLTDALKAQKDALAGESDDTEQLRVQLRSYRDLLNRLSAL